MEKVKMVVTHSTGALIEITATLQKSPCFNYGNGTAVEVITTSKEFGKNEYFEDTRYEVGITKPQGLEKYIRKWIQLFYGNYAVKIEKINT